MLTHQTQLSLDEDGAPVWPSDPGTELVPGHRGWQRLGVGHRCETWLAWSSSSWCPVVVKLARPHQVDHPRARGSLAREVAALEGLTHPNLPRLVAADPEAPRPYVLLEYVDGPDLDGVLSRRRLSTESVILLGAQLLSALVPVHARGLAHLDIKPENIMIRDGRPVLVDFGSAREIGRRQPAGQPVGTLGWAAPEMEACAPVSAAMDLWSVGTVLSAALRRLARPRAELRALLADLTATDPSRRPALPEALARVADLAPAERRPWPLWVGTPAPLSSGRGVLGPKSNTAAQG